jgi:hypothetical protein
VQKLAGVEMMTTRMVEEAVAAAEDLEAAAVAMMTMMTATIP